MKTINLSTLEEFSFDESTTPLWAACYGYCQENNLMWALCAAAQDKKLEQFAETLPVVYGEKTVSVGDWTAISE